MLPETPETMRQELDVRRFYTLSLAQTRGYAHDVLLNNLTRTLTLSDRLDDRSAHDMLCGLATLHASRADCGAAAVLGGQLLTLAAAGPLELVASAHCLMGLVALWSGDLASAALRLAEVRRASGSTTVSPWPWFGVDPAVGAVSHDSLRLMLVGEEAGAQAQQTDAIGDAIRRGPPFTIAQALAFGAIVEVLAQRWTDAVSTASRGMSIAQEHAFPLWVATTAVCRGRALVALGDMTGGLQDIRAGMDVMRDAGLRLGRSLLLALESAACLEIRSVDAGFTAVNEGLAHCRDTSERLFESELWRLKGELLLLRAEDERDLKARARLIADAADSIAQALAVARRLGARVFERHARRSRMRLPHRRALDLAG